MHSALPKLPRWLATHVFLPSPRNSGSGAFPYHATLFDKSPTSNWLVVWHQDTALPLRERKALAGWGPWSVKEGVNYAHAPASALRQVLALRVHLDDSTEHNGPLRVLPGTHTRGVLSDEEIERSCLKRRLWSVWFEKEAF
jgi:ectoine hydroxylase-related dioxygenase (phytanoyl-CoA dioxygenase family)